MLPYAIVSITLALVFYSIGVWSEKIQGGLRPWHLGMFWTGFAFDTAGTTMMSELAGTGFVLNFHGITGLLAILLMAVHAIWASIVLARKNEAQKKTFHRFSIFVWCVWLIPYLSGAVFGMAR